MRPDRHRRERAEAAAMPAAGRGLKRESADPGNALRDARRLYRLGRHPEAITALSPALSAEADADDRRAAALLRAWCLVELKRHDEVRRWLADAQIDGLRADDPALRALELNLALFEGRHDEVAAETATLLETVTDTSDPVHAELRLLLGAALRWQGRLREAVSHVEFACSAFTVLDEPVRGAVAANFLGWTFLSQGRLDESRRWFEKSLAINSQLGARARLAQNYQNLAIVCYKQGDYEPAAELLTSELALVGKLPDMQCRARLALGNVRRLREEFAAARTDLLEAYAAAREHRFTREETLALEFLGDVCRDEGCPAEARVYYRRAMGLARRLAPRGDLVMELLRREGECLDLEGRHVDALRVLDEALTMAVEVGDRYETAIIRRCLGVNAGHLGRLPVARRELEEASGELHAMTARHEAMTCDYHLARVLRRAPEVGGTHGAGSDAMALAWRSALRAQQASQDLGVPGLAGEIAAVVAELSRLRLRGDTEQPLWRTFSAKRAPSTRVVAVSAALQQTLRRCDGFARHTGPVLLFGEDGTGRAALARRLHENGPRGALPFLRLDCAGGDSATLAWELEGEAGDGTSGLLSRAAGGTLLLAGIEALPPALQMETLRLVRDGAWRRRCDGGEMAPDVRIMATAGDGLAALAEAGRFRPDLYFRLRLMTVRVAPLRERKQDVLPLLDHFLSRLEGSTLTARSVFDVAALSAMAEHHWPGNVAELEAVAQQAWLCRRHGLPVVVRRDETGDCLVIDDTAEVAEARNPRLSGSALQSLIARTGGNKARAARQLGVSRMTLYRWLRQADPTPR
ncbi:MAG: tetratricopeptide repeat protein [bacterium]|nr:tetratricopeptide repeat protein [bacterium]